MSKSSNYITAPAKNGSASDITENLNERLLSQIGTGRILWHLVKRHKFTLVLIWAIVVTISYMFPPVWDILFAIVG